MLSERLLARMQTFKLWLTTSTWAGLQRYHKYHTHCTSFRLPELIYQKSRDSFCMMTGLIIIPLSLREIVLSQIHDSHQGLTKCHRRANMSVWWSGIGRDINKLVKRMGFV